MERQLRLMQKTVKELFAQYDEECCRINYEDKKMAQQAIRNELKCRAEQMFRLLESGYTGRFEKLYELTFEQPAVKRS